MRTLDLESIKLNYLNFVSGLKTIMLSTVDGNGNPFSSYAPFIIKDGKIYVYISEIANHYQHLEASPVVDVMLIDDESQTPNLFARQRARFRCTARNVGNEGHDEVFEQFERIFGKPLISMLRGLDFSLFTLSPGEGRYVAGFGQAFDIDLAGDRFEPVVRDGHSQSKRRV